MVGVRDALSRFRRATAGNTAIMFAVAAIPITGAVGAAVDYSNANRVRTQLIAAADAAAIGAIGRPAPSFNTAISMTQDASIQAGITDAVKVFKAEASNKHGFTLGKVNAAVAKANGQLTATIDFTATVPAQFMGLMGVKSIKVTGTSSAANTLPVFADFYLLLDNSPSMGVAATPDDINTMVANTPDKCAFGCHDLSTTDNYYNLAHKLGVKMRIDVLRQATQQLMDTAATTAIVANQFRMAIYTFSTDVQTIATLTSSLSTAKSLAANIDLTTVPYQGYNNDQYTAYEKVMPAINQIMPNPGDGTSYSTPQKILFFVSDGVGDSNIGGKRTIAPIDPALCTSIKNRGIKIAVLYTTYLPLPTNPFYKANVAGWSNTIGPAMEKCASAGLFFEVSPSQGIPQAMAALFQKAVAQARLTK